MKENQEKQKDKPHDRAVRMAELLARPLPQIQPYDQQSDADEELLYAEPFYEELRDSLSSLIEALHADGVPDWDAARGDVAGGLNYDSAVRRERRRQAN